MMRPMSIAGAPKRCAVRDRARARATLPPWLGRVAMTWARMRAPVRARAPTMSAALWRTNSSGQRNWPPFAGSRVRARERLVLRRPAAVGGRQLRPGRLDGGVVDLVRRNGREQVLDRVARGLAPPDRGGPLDRLHLGEPRPHLGPSRQVGAAEHDALTGGGRQERRFGRGAGVQPRASYRGRLADGAPSGGTHGQSAPGPRARSRSSPGDTEPPARGSTRGGRAPGSL